MTRTTWFGRTTSTGTVAATRGAVVALDRTDRLPLRGYNSWTAVALHELGHAMGLAHPNDSGELMNAVLPRTLASLQTGDRTGLYKLGRAQGCISF
ncbi:MAG: matrixin family metalloprotease [Actinobacteria bacterium]|nr:matrixin family metalloprotease [Actinomycetota bacterium]MCA1720232.1 matrixin family metalloprotease [Actinomycetota bacterium]